MARQEGNITETELSEELKKKILEAYSNSLNTKLSIGNLRDLSTGGKSTLVQAINETFNTLRDVLGTATLITNDKTIRGAINEVRNSINKKNVGIYVSSREPSNDEGNNGDIWIKY